MRLTVVGCAGSFPAADSPCSCYLVEADGRRLVLDLGNGALGALQRYVSLYEVDAVVLSHLHPDHYIDMCAYWVARKYRPGGVPPALPVYGPPGTALQLAQAYGLDSRPELGAVFDFRTLTPGGFALGPFHLRVDRVVHPVDAFAVRIEHNGRSLTYSGDTGASEALIRLASGSDLLLCEASFTDGRDEVAGLHLNGREAGEHAAKAGVGSLVLTHIPPWTDAARNVADARRAFSGPVTVAEAGQRYEV
jgi:ribonuclease BN (tRNA processing enzyme)